MTTLKNNNVYITFHEKSEFNHKPYIMVRDLTDVYNEESAFTKKVRGIAQAWQFINQIMNDERLKEDLKFWDIVKILDNKFNLSTHVYCAMD